MRILVAEDDALSRALVVRMLRELGHEVTATLDGEAAWEAFRREPFPVVVTDWNMPECDGVELARRIRTVRTRTYTWIVMLTGMDFTANYRQTMEAGIDDFLVKPLDPQLLLVRLAVAERVQRMNDQVVALTSALPICMHCKAVRGDGDRWRRVEEYFHDIDFSHSYCPDCFYEHTLRPELQRMRADGQWAARLPAADENCTLDTRVLDALAAFEKADCPGLLGDMIGSFTECAEVLRQDLYGYGASGLLGGDVLERLRRCCGRCDDLGLGRLGAVLTRIATAKPREAMKRHVELGEGATAELDQALAALGEAREASAPTK
jgi:phosphoserine phosphatase RsbU/P